MKKLTWKEVLNEANRRGRILNTILELHQPEQIFDEWFCTHCLQVVDWETDQAPWPCETARILLKHPGHKPLTDHGETQ